MLHEQLHFEGNLLESETILFQVNSTENSTSVIKKENVDEKSHNHNNYLCDLRIIITLEALIGLLIQTLILTKTSQRCSMG